ncbi:MAG: hypothetical protein H0X25_04300 [Acidobacteriales bacterium]|nr:hypothetical protein [Terriglobales bacterium]
MTKDNTARESIPSGGGIRLLGIRPAFVTVEFFVDLLNDRKYLEEIISQQQALSRGTRRGDPGRLDVKSAAEIGFRLLRELTDEWLNSGLTKRRAEQPITGPERPMRRSLKKCPRIKSAAELHNSIAHMETYAVTEHAIRICYGMCDVGPLPDQLTQHASRIAVRLVVGMCNSEWKFKVAKCRKCSDYYRLVKTQHYYVRGTRHRNCFSKGSSQLCKETGLKREQRRKLTWAVRAYIKLGNKGKLPQRSDFSECLCAELQKRRGASSLVIKKNWFTRNRDTIEMHGDAALTSPRRIGRFYLP